MGQIIFHFGPSWGMKGEERMEKLIYYGYTITLKLLDKFNSNFALLYLSSYSSIKCDTFFSKMWRKTIR